MRKSPLGEDQALKEVLSDVLDTPVSPELLPPVDGVIAQRTEELCLPEPERRTGVGRHAQISSGRYRNAAHLRPVRQAGALKLLTPVSPELLPPVDGVIAQRTEELVGPYELHDFFLYYMLRWGFQHLRALPRLPVLISHVMLLRILPDIGKMNRHRIFNIDFPWSAIWCVFMRIPVRMKR